MFAKIKKSKRFQFEIIPLLLSPYYSNGLVFKGDVAQLVEQRTENPCVGGSIPSVTTKKSVEKWFFLHFFTFIHTSLETQTIFLRFLHFETTRQAVSKHLRILTECSSQGGNIIMLSQICFSEHTLLPLPTGLELIGSLTVLKKNKNYEKENSVCSKPAFWTNVYQRGTQ